jgi:aspartyl-tRNA synthetase
MAYADGSMVMQRVETLIKQVYEKLCESPRTKNFKFWTDVPALPKNPFYRMTYDEAMSHHGSDKPDLRIPGLVCFSPLQTQLRAQPRKVVFG